MNKTLVVILIASSLLFVGFGGTAADEPGEGVEVTVARASWQSAKPVEAITTLLMEKLGYDVKPPKQMSNPIFYLSLKLGDVDYWPNTWWPLHKPQLPEDFEENASIIGNIVDNGAIQGFLVDKKTAEKYGITNLNDFKRREVRDAFDYDNNGKANLGGCPPGWGCGHAIGRILDTFDMREYIEVAKPGYSAMFADRKTRYHRGEPIFYYTWTPNYTIVDLVPSEDVVWINVPSIKPINEAQESLVAEEGTDVMVTEDLQGAVTDTAITGWPVGDIRFAANDEFLASNPSAKRLMELIEISVSDVSEMTKKIAEGKDSRPEVLRMAKEWIQENHEKVESWLDKARAATGETGMVEKASVMVKVTDSSGSNLRAKVYLDGTYKGETGRDGHYTISNLSPEAYKLKVKKGGYLTATKWVQPSTGAQEDIRFTLEKRNKPPNPSFTYSPDTPKINETVNFISTSSDPDGTIDDYSWTFRDGSTSSSKNPTHTYTEPATYEVELTVTDDDGATDSTTKKIIVENRKPTASFTYTPKEPKMDQKVTFDASASSDPDGKIVGYSWDLNGDGSYDASGTKEFYTYDSRRTYTVKLKVTDNNRGSASTTQKITVKEKEEVEQETKIEDKYGLVIGISKYKSDLIKHLNYPKKDAKAFYRFLTKGGNFSKNKVSLLVNDQATTENISKSFSNLVTKTERNDLVLIYYSGHGTYGPDYNKDEEDGHDEYYVTYDTDTSDGDSLYHTGISDDQFGNWINSIQSKRVAIILDSCYSGGATKSAKTTNLPTHTGKAGPKNTVFNDFSFENRLLFAASGENQQSFEAPPSADFNHGVFTHFMLKGLKGAADKDNDSNITAEEVYSYVKPKVQNYVTDTFSSYNQTPLMKGVSTIPLVTREEKLKGEVKYVKGSDNTKATKDEFVMINLGSEDGVNKGDTLKVYFTDKEAGVFRQVQGKLEVKEIAGLHLSLCKVVEANYLVKKGDRVEKLK